MLQEKRKLHGSTVLETVLKEATKLKHLTQAFCIGSVANIAILIAENVTSGAS